MAYREADRPRTETRVVDFDRLPEPVRERFARATRGLGAPEPLVAERPDAPGTVARWGAAALLSGALLCALARLGFGDVESAAAVQPGFLAAGYVAASVVLAVSLVLAGRLVLLRGRLPYLPGRYLFAIDLVETDGRILHVTSLAGLREVQSREVLRRGRYVETEVGLSFDGGAIEEISVVGREAAASVVAQLGRAREAAERAVLPENVATLERVDPFFEVRVAKDWEGVAPASTKRARRRPRRPRRGLGRVLVPAVLAGAAAGPVAFWVRNARSDDAMFRAVGEPASARTLRAYLARGHRHLEQADALLFDHAVSSARSGYRRELERYLEEGGRHAAKADDELFALAKRGGDVEDLNEYLAHAKRHADEVRRQLLPRAALSAAQRQASVAALRAFLAENPAAPRDVVREAKRSIHARYADALEMFRVQGEKRSPRALSFVTRLLEYLESHGGEAVRLRLTRRPDASIEERDVEETRRDPDRYAPAAPSFDAFHATAIERRIAENLESSIAQVFPRDVLHLATSDDPAAIAPPPGMDVSYQAFAPGGTYVSTVSGRRYLEVRLSFHVTLQIPHDPGTFSFKAEVRPPREGFDVTEDDGDPLGPSALVYRRMVEHAVGSLVLKLQDELLRVER